MRNKFKIFAMIISLAITVGCSSSKPSSNTEQLPTLTPANKQNAAKINVELGFYYLQQGDYKRSQAKLLTALQEAPNSPKANSAMGYFFEKIDEASRAKQYYLRAIKLDPKDSAAHNNFGTFLCRHNEYDAAIKEFKIAVADENYLNAAKAYENAGICAKKIPNLHLAKQFFLKAIHRDPSLTTSLLSLSSLYYHEGKYRTANNYLNKYLSIAQPTKQATQLKVAINKKLRHKAKNA